MNGLFLSLPLWITAHINIENIPEDSIIFFQAYIPWVQKVWYIENVDIIIEYVNSNDQKLIQEWSKYIIFDDWKDWFSFDVYFLLYSIFRVKVLEKWCFAVHSSCININGRNVLIVWHSGSWKSTIALSLMMNGWKMISWNKTLLDSDMNILAWTNTMTIRQNDESKYQSIIWEKLNYFNRTAFKLPSENYSYWGKITDIIIVRINDWVEEFSTVNPQSALHLLFPYFMDKVNSDAIVCWWNDIFVWNLTNHKSLLKDIKNSLEWKSVYNIAWSLDFIVDKILKLW